MGKSRKDHMGGEVKEGSHGWGSQGRITWVVKSRKDHMGGEVKEGSHGW